MAGRIDRLNDLEWHPFVPIFPSRGDSMRDSYAACPISHDCEYLRGQE
jgi:hypothetical protein